MTEQDRERFANLLTSIADFYNQRLSELIYDIYFEALQKYPYEVVKQAFKLAVETHRYNTLPKPIEIVEVIEGSVEDRALLAWRTIIEAIRRVGPYESIKFEDPLINYVLGVMFNGRWYEVCRKTKDELEYKIKPEFIRLYLVYHRGGRILNKEHSYLCGFHEENNRQGGFYDYISPPIRVECKYLPEKKFKELIKGREEKDAEIIRFDK